MKRSAYKGANAVVFVADSGLREMEAELGPLDNASVIRPGVEVPDIARRDTRNNDVVFVGRWSEGKDPLTALRAYAEASRGLPDPRLLMFGAGPLEATLQNICSESRLDGVRLMGWSADPLADTRRGGVFLQTSQWENSPYAVLDAMASGLTVVAHAVGDVAFMLDFGKAGIPVDANNFPRLVDSLRRAMSDGPLRSRFATSAPARVRSHYQRAEMVRRTIDIYQRALERSP